MRSNFRQLKTNGQGYVLPLAIGLGLALMILGLTAALFVQTDRNIAAQRRQNGASLAVAEGAADRVMVLLSRRENAILMGRNYDPINPRTGRNYLGADGLPNSGDETTTVTDEWTNYNPSVYSCFIQAGVGAPTPPMTGIMGPEGTYTLLAYRYIPARHQGMLLLEGRYRGQVSRVALSIGIKPEQNGFPGIGLIRPWPSDPAGVLALRGRSILGRNGNVYAVTGSSTASPLSGQSEPGDATRSQYLDYIWSASADGATSDTVAGRITTCDPNIVIPTGITGTNFGVITTNQTFSGVGASVPTLYRVDKITLDSNETLTIDTTGGPVVIEMTNSGAEGISLYHQAKIRNIRTDGKLPQVGDARIIIRGDRAVYLFHQSCIENVFLYSSLDTVEFLTTGPGCSSGRNTNFEGVIWAEAILSSKNHAGNRNICYLGLCGLLADNTVTHGATSGIYVPEDMSSLADLLRYTNLPIRYRISGITQWQQVQ